MKNRIIFILISSLFFMLMLSQVRAQDSHIAQATLQRPTLVSTGLPPVNQQTALTASPTSTTTRTPSATRTPTLTPTASATRTATFTATATVTYTVTSSQTPTGTYTAVPSNTPTLTFTASPSSTLTATTAITLTSTASEEPSSTLTATRTSTNTNTPTATFTQTSSPTPTSTPSPSPTVTETSIPINVVSSPQASTGKGDNPLSPLFLMGLAVLAILSIYVIYYATNASAIDRYATGFPLRTCPVCGEGHLDIEERPYRVLGIPRVRRTVRCDNCRSILREVGRRRWRYSVDPNANPEMFQEHNNTVMTEAALMTFAQDAADSHVHYLDDE